MLFSIFIELFSLFYYVNKGFNLKKMRFNALIIMVINVKYYDLIICGGSASGLAAAINSKRLHPEYSVAVLEKLPRVGKKILSTGNGRCNLTNLNASEHNYRHKSFTEYAFSKYSPKGVIDFFSSLGLLTYSDKEGRVYPRSNTATAVLDALRYGAEKEGVELVTECALENAEKKGEKFVVNGKYECAYLIIATGGKSSPVQGSDGSGYPIAKKFGHKVTSLFPALVPLSTKPEAVRSLKGIRATNVRLVLDDKTTCGEILFTDSGISGIAAMELASTAERILYDGEKAELIIDFVPEMNENELKTYIENSFKIKKNQPMENLLCGILPKALGVFILKEIGFYQGEGTIDKYSENIISLIAEKIKSYNIQITGTKGFRDSQVTSGGVRTDEINEKTMMSKLCKNLYFAGEITDVDGDCGGFNLQWAFASGLLAGELND